MFPLPSKKQDHMTKDIQLLELEADFAEANEHEISILAEEREIHRSEAEQLIADRGRIAIQICWEEALIHFNSALSHYPFRKARSSSAK